MLTQGEASDTRVYGIITSYLKEVALSRNLTPIHMYTFATHLLESGADSKGSGTAGHSRMSSTQIYTHNRSKLELFIKKLIRAKEGRK